MRGARVAVGVAILWTVAATAAGCGGGGTSPGGDGGAGIAAGPLSGKIGGVAWTIGSAESNAFLSTGNRFFVDVYGETITPCTGAGSSVSGNRLILNVPKVAGDYALGLNLTETFYVQSTNFNDVATSGRMVVADVTSTTVTGGARFQFDANNFVDGQFEFTICP